MAKVTYEIEGRGGVKALADLKRAQKELAGEAGQTEKKLTDMEKAARRIQEANDPTKRYNRQIKETARLANQGKISIQDAEKAAKRYGDRLDRAGRSGRDAFGDKALGQVKSLVTGYLSAQAALRLITTEMQKQKELREEQTQAQLSVAQAEQNFRQNTFFLDPGQRTKFIGDVKGIAGQANLPQAEILTAGKDLFSATGDVELTKKLLRITTQFTRDPSDIAPIAGGLGDISTTSGIRDEKQLLGFLATVQANARLTEVSSAGRQVGKVLSGFTAPTAGSDAATGAALFAALTKGTADPTGELSRTAAVNTIDRLGKFFSEGSVSSRFRPEQIDTFNEQLALTRGTALGREFVESDSFQFRAATKGGVAKLFLGDESLNRDFESTRAALGDRTRLGATASDAVKFVNAGALAATAQQELAVSSGAESNRLATSAQLSTKAREDLIELLAVSKGLPNTQQRLETFLSSGLTLDRGEAIEQIEFALGIAESGARNGLQQSDRQSAANTALLGILDKLSSIEANQRGGRLSPEGLAE